jgi:hypothetical protein
MSCARHSRARRVIARERAISSIRRSKSATRASSTSRRPLASPPRRTAICSSDMAGNGADVTDQLDVVVGGGSAGLQAALTLGRMRRRVLLLDSGEYRNAASRHMHNFIGHDGDEPGRLRAAARADITGYDTVAVRSARVTAIEAHGDGWRLGSTSATVSAHARSSW